MLNDIKNAFIAGAQLMNIRKKTTWQKKENYIDNRDMGIEQKSASWFSLHDTYNLHPRQVKKIRPLLNIP